MRTLLQGVLGVALFGLLYLNYRLYYRPEMTLVRSRPVNQDLVNQLHFLKGRLHEGAAQDMQALYPEGFVYLNALYGLTWTELAAGLPHTNPLYREALAETDWAIRAIASPAGRELFEAELPVLYGAYYQGWSTYLLGRYLAVQPPARRARAGVHAYQQQCEQIAKALRQSPSPYPESYWGAAWPADGVMCVAALAWHDRLLMPRYRPLIQQWLTSVDSHLDSLGLIPHQTHAGTGRVIEVARGSSQSQLLNFLIEIDSAYARRHFAIYRKHFLSSRFGLPSVKEAAQEAVDAEDIDSGPVILGVGGAASIVGRRTMQHYGDTTTAVGLRNSIEAFGFPLQWGGHKRYLFGQLPIADAFIAWSNSLEAHHELTGSPGWRGGFHWRSALVAVVLLVALFYLRKKPI